MALFPPITELASELDFAAVLKRFVAVNDARLRRTRDALRPRQRDFLDLLPLFFHINHPVLPGYSKDCPAGVHGYTPERAALEAANRLGRAFHYSRQLHRLPHIQAIYLMGSPGSVAYSGESDFDIWLCHDGSLDEAQIGQLREKATAVETWAGTLDLEVHFFLVRPDQFRRGETEALSAESSGTAQQRLLLDEFYRTSLRLAGMYPMWWLVPPGQESEYERYVEEIRRQRYLHARDLIDFGGLGHVPAEEFLGAAVWQLYKGIDSPYKSVLKLLLIESYAREYPYLDLLSLRYKQAVYGGEVDIDHLDPYIMMLAKVEEYLRGLGENERLGLARRCFYFKVNERLSNEDASLAHWRRSLLSSRVRDWGWVRADLFVLDGRSGWKIDRISEERRILFEALSESYRFLSNFARRYAGSALISQRDLTILGRKLYAAFERKAGKVEMLARGIAADLHENQLTVHEVVDDPHAPSGWVVYRGVVKPEDKSQHAPLKRFRFITELVAWCYFNQVADRNTQLMVVARQSRLTSQELRAMVGRMQAAFPDRATRFGTVTEFGEPAQVVQTLLFVNAGLDPLARGEGADGRIASGRSDALSYGGLAENLVHTVDQVVVTTWQEVLTFHHVGAKGLMECLSEFLKWTPLASGRMPSVPEVASYSPTKGNAVARRVEELFQCVVDCYYTQRRPAATRYVVQVEQGFHVLSFDGDNPRHQMLESQTALMRYLGAPQKEFSPVVFDRYAHAEKILPLVFEYNRAGTVQFFYRPQGTQVDIYVLDERGSLFYRRSPFHDGEALLSQYSHFFEAVLNRVNFLMQEGRSVRAAEGLEFYLVDAEAGGRLRIQRQQPRFQSGGMPYISLQVLADVDETGQAAFALYCNGQEFTSSGGGQALDAVVKYVLNLRGSGSSYPIYITDISMSPAVLGEEGVERIQTIHFLNYKHRIEERLNQAMGTSSR